MNFIRDLVPHNLTHLVHPRHWLYPRVGHPAVTTSELECGNDMPLDSDILNSLIPDTTTNGIISESDGMDIDPTSNPSYPL